MDFQSLFWMMQQLRCLRWHSCLEQPEAQYIQFLIIRSIVIFLNSLYRKQEKRTDHKECLAKMKELLDHRPEDATSPYMLYLFDQVYEQYVGKKNPMRK